MILHGAHPGIRAIRKEMGRFGSRVPALIPPGRARSSALRFVIASRSDRSHQKIPVWACVREIRYERATVMFSKARRMRMMTVWERRPDLSLRHSHHSRDYLKNASCDHRIA